MFQIFVKIATSIHVNGKLQVANSLVELHSYASSFTDILIDITKYPTSFINPAEAREWIKSNGQVGFEYFILECITI